MINNQNVSVLLITINVEKNVNFKVFWIFNKIPA
jgi:hypothetical protein